MSAIKLYRALLGVAAAILVGTAGLHATGLSGVTATLAQSDVPADWQPVFAGLWLMFSIHLVIVACLLAVLAAVPPGRAVLAMVAVLPIADTVLLLTMVGVFVGSIMTALAAALCLAAIVTLPPALAELRTSSTGPG